MHILVLPHFWALFLALPLLFLLTHPLRLRQPPGVDVPEAVHGLLDGAVAAAVVEVGDLLGVGLGVGHVGPEIEGGAATESKEKLYKM